MPWLMIRFRGQRWWWWWGMDLFGGVRKVKPRRALGAFHLLQKWYLLQCPQSEHRIVILHTFSRTILLELLNMLHILYFIHLLCIFFISFDQIHSFVIKVVIFSIDIDRLLINRFKKLSCIVHVWMWKEQQKTAWASWSLITGIQPSEFAQILLSPLTVCFWK